MKGAHVRQLGLGEWRNKKISSFSTTVSNNSHINPSKTIISLFVHIYFQNYFEKYSYYVSNIRMMLLVIQLKHKSLNKEHPIWPQLRGGGRGKEK